MYTHLLKYYFSVRSSKNQKIEDVKRFQLKAFSKIFDYAKENSPFYRNLYSESGILNLKINTWDDVEKVPIIDKSVMRKYSTQDIMTRPITSDLIPHTTSGTSGDPFTIYQNKSEEFTAHVRVLSMLRDIGYHPFKKIVMISRYEASATFEVEKQLSLLGKLQKRFGMLQREIISIYEEPKIMLSKIQYHQPYILWSTPSVLEMICNEAIRQNTKLNIPYIILTSENVLERQYEKFRTYIGKNIISHYGLMECPTIGYEKNASGEIVVYPNTVLVQYDQIQNGQGTPIITNLLNYTMPFIRYSTKDTGPILNRKDFPNKVMGNIIGRMDDILTFPDGKLFVHHHAYEMFTDFVECEQYKFIQNTKDYIIMQIQVAPETNKEDVKNKAIQRWSRRFPIEYLKIEFVDRFYIDKKTGKFKNIENLCR